MERRGGFLLQSFYFARENTLYEQLYSQSGYLKHGYQQAPKKNLTEYKQNNDLQTPPD